MRRTELTIPAGNIGLGDAFERVYSKLGSARVTVRDPKLDLGKVPAKGDGSVSLKGIPDLPYAMLESEALQSGLVIVKPDRTRPGICGLDPKALALEDEARGRVERLLREALSAGELCAFAYNPDGVGWGEIADRDAWRKPSPCPGLENFIDPDTSPGPNVMGSPVFVERNALEKWLARKVRDLADPRIHTGNRGRPSAKSLILDEFKRRCLEDEATRRGGESVIKERLSDEARELLAWLKRNHPNADPEKVPKEHAICRALSPLFNEYRTRKSRNI